MPVRAWEGVRDQFSSRSELIAENERLKAESLLMQRRVQKLAALTEQNVRLRELLNSAALVDDKVLVSELIGVDPNPFTQRIMIDKGENDGVFVGQPVLDASGLMGQVVEVMPYTARVLLLTDTTHSIPVQVNRNGLRAIAVGTGNPERLNCATSPTPPTSRKAIYWSAPAWGNASPPAIRWPRSGSDPRFRPAVRRGARGADREDEP